MTDRTPPQDVQRAAQRGLDLRAEHGRGGLSTAAANLANGDAVSLDTVQRMRAFFQRHERNYRPDETHDDGGPTAGTIAWLLWGGDPGRAWADRILREQAEIEKVARPLQLHVRVAKADEQLGLVFGYAIVCTENDQPYFDTQGDHIPDASMLRATARFMAGSRMAKVMHEGESLGQVVFGFPLTADIADSLGIPAERTGFIVGMRPDDDAILAKYVSGELTGFSIGGSRVKETVIDE